MFGYIASGILAAENDCENKQHNGSSEMNDIIKAMRVLAEEIGKQAVDAGDQCKYESAVTLAGLHNALEKAADRLDSES